MPANDAVAGEDEAEREEESFVQLRNGKKRKRAPCYASAAKIRKKTSTAPSSSGASSSSPSPSENVCCVCFLNKIEIVLTPFGDVKLCEGCWLEIARRHSEYVFTDDDIDFSNDENCKPKCPCCNQSVDNYLKVFF